MGCQRDHVRFDREFAGGQQRIVILGITNRYEVGAFSPSSRSAACTPLAFVTPGGNTIRSPRLWMSWPSRPP